MRRLMLENMKGGGDMTEWKLIADSDVAGTNTVHRIDVDSYDEYFITGNIIADSASALWIVVNREDIDWANLRIAKIPIGVNANPSKKFILRMKKIRADFWLVTVTNTFEGVLGGESREYVIAQTPTIPIKYFAFLAESKTLLKSGNVKIYGR